MELLIIKTCQQNNNIVIPREGSKVLQLMETRHFLLKRYCEFVKIIAYNYRGGSNTVMDRQHRKIIIFDWQVYYERGTFFVYFQ